ncbi:GNAT family N-acetyltransferase [Lactobacillaceae bacterium Scapto_B20]
MDEVKIRPLTLADNDAFFVMVNDEQTAQAAGFTVATSLKASAELLSKVINNQQALAITVDDSVAGVLLLSEQVTADGTPDDQNLELAFMLRRSFQHRGIMTKALQQLLTELQQAQKVATLIANVMNVNRSSKRVLRRVGFIQMGTFNDFNHQLVCQFKIGIDK